MLFYQTMVSPIGEIILINKNNYLFRLEFLDQGLDKFLSSISFKLQKAGNNVSVFKTAIIQLEEYFNGKRRSFDIPLDPVGTKFQLKVWQELLNIPYGKTVSYKEIAERIENPKSYRAVGMANNRNPIPIIIPCHRVIGKNGSLIGYGGGLDKKKYLLDLERSK